MTPLEQSMEEDRKALEQEPEKEGIEKIIDDVALAKPEDEPDPVDPPEGEEEEEEEEDEKVAAKPEHPAKARITAREEREARIAAEVAAAELRGRMAAQDEYRRQQQQAAPKKQVPDPDFEPEAYAQHLINETRVDVDAVARYAKQTNDTHAANILNLMTDLAETKAVAADPDYQPAKAFVVEKKLALLKHQHGELLRAQYPTATTEQIDDYLRKHAQSDVEQQVIHSVQRRQDVAKTVKEMASLYGYTATPGKKQESGYKPNLSNIKKNMEKSSNLMGGSSRGKSGSPSAEQLADATLSDLLGVSSDQFDTAVSNSFH